MNKSELIAITAERSGISPKDTEAVISAALDVITDALADDERVQLVGFGVFDTRRRAARQGRNPRTREIIEIPATKIPVFKAGKGLKEAVAK